MQYEKSMLALYLHQRRLPNMTRFSMEQQSA